MHVEITLHRYRHPRLLWHHPRTRGNNLRFSSEFRPGLASPPHAGIRLTCIHKRFYLTDGITPVHRESTRRLYNSDPLLRHHPRTRGFDDESEGMQSDQQGITPAHGDPTQEQQKRSIARRLHPRTRGIDASRHGYKDRSSASPPYTGNRPFSDQFVDAFFGITPAYRESTMTQCMRSRSQWLHPRTRGIYSTQTLRFSVFKRPRHSDFVHSFSSFSLFFSRTSLFTVVWIFAISFWCSSVSDALSFAANTVISRYILMPSEKWSARRCVISSK